MSFINEDFLLETPEARKLYHDYAEGLPILDYHNHLDPRRIAHDLPFRNLSEAWLSEDHYKWRAMRTLGVEERLISGKATDEEKFEAWAASVPPLVRNPLYHWTHLELQRYFGITDLLDELSGPSVYSRANAQLRDAHHTPRRLLERMKVEVICTTDDPADSLEFHRELADGERPATPSDLSRPSGFSMLPTFRPDRVFNLSDPEAYRLYLDRLEEASGHSIQNYTDLLEALEHRLAFFAENGCVLADHGLEALPYFQSLPCAPAKVFIKVLEGSHPTPLEQSCFTFALLSHLCKRYHHYGWVQQFHLGALRNTNPRVYAHQGPDSGCDSIGDMPQAQALAGFLGHLEASDSLAKTILYTLNPAWNEVFATMAGNFNGGGVRGKVQFGSGWWYNDQLDGMTRQIEALSNMGVISTFVGMLTDSRSLLSFPRHEYFRRLVCNLFGSDIHRGRLPSDLSHMGKIIGDICYFNAKRYFNFQSQLGQLP